MLSALSRRAVASPYFWMSLAALVYACIAAVRQPWGNDFGLHAAVVERLRQDLVEPMDPMVDFANRSPYFTPYTVMLGLVARITGWSAITALSMATPLCVALLLYGMYRFVRIFSEDRWAPPVALAVVFTLWGAKAFAWSGFLNVSGLPGILPWPSMVALGFTLIWWAYLWHSFDEQKAWRWAVVGAFLGIVMLIHPFTAVSACLGGLAIAIARWREIRPPMAALAVAAAVVVILVWPYYSFGEMLSSGSSLNPIHEVLYVDAWGKYLVVLLLCLPALIVRLRRNVRDPLWWLFAFAGAAVFTGWLSGAWALGRIWPTVMLSAQVALAIELVRLLSHGHRKSVPVLGWAVATVVACGWYFEAHHANFVQLMRPDRHITAFSQKTPWITERIRPGDVVLVNGHVTQERWLSRDLIAHGILFVAPPWPDQGLADEDERWNAVNELMKAETSQSRRRELLHRYSVRWIIDTKGDRAWADSLAVEIIEGPGSQRLLRLS